MIFITKSGKEIQVPNDYTYMSMEKFAKEVYQQGRADKYKEITSEYMLLTEQQVADIRADAERDFQNSDYWNDYLEDIKRQIRADAIDELKKKIEFEEKWLFDCKIFDTNVTIAFETLKSFAEQLKEQANE